MPRRKPSSRSDAAPRLATRVIHAGQSADPATGAVNTPVYLTSTYKQLRPGRPQPFNYARSANPTRRALERNLAELEGGVDARCFASGMAAVSAVLDLLSAGDHVVAAENVYGGTRRLFEGLLRRQGLSFTWVDATRVQPIVRALRPETRIVFLETPANPTLTLSDIAAVSRLTRARGVRLVVDNTFMTPFFQRPIELGADLVVHSTTKYLNGHSDSVGGCVVSARDEDAERVAWLQNAVGAILSPLDSYLVLRGVKTLAVRMERHERNAREIAARLAERKDVVRVLYPGLRSHPQHRLARRQMTGFGGVVSFDLGSRAAARRFLRRLRLCPMAESLGGVETLISHPATMTHGSLAPAERRRIGVTDGLIRASVGIEDVEDLWDDLRRALEAK